LVRNHVAAVIPTVLRERNGPTDGRPSVAHGSMGSSGTKYAPRVHLMKDALHAFRRKVRERSEPGAVVVGLNPTGLGLVRSLGRRGTPVLAVVSDLRNACVGTRYCEKVYCPDIEGPELIDTCGPSARRWMLRRCCS